MKSRLNSSSFLAINMLIFLCFLGLFAQCLAEAPPPPFKFNDTKLIGTWYEWSRRENYYQANQICGTLNFTKGDDGYLIERYEAVVQDTGGMFTWEGKVVPQSEEAGSWILQFPSFAKDKSISIKFEDANWDHWVILHGFIPRDGQLDHLGWIWSKTPTLEPKYIAEIIHSLNIHNLPIQGLDIVPQTNCPNHA